jgi:hypothetical protein
MQFDAVRRDSCLSVQEIEHTNAGDCDWYVGGLKAGGYVEFRIELGPRICDATQKRAPASNTMGRRYLANHGIAAAVTHDKMIIFVAFELVLRKGCVDDPDRGFRRLHSIIGRNRIGRGKAPEMGNRGLCRRIQINKARIRVSPRLDRPSLYAAGQTGREKMLRNRSRDSQRKEEAQALLEHSSPFKPTGRPF